MMAPCYERMRLLGKALDEAAPMLAGPIDRMECRSGRIRFWSGSECVAVAGRYVQHHAPDGSPMPGSGHYEVEARTLGVGLFGWLRRALAGASDADKARRADAVAAALESATFELQQPLDALRMDGDDAALAWAGALCVRVTGIEAALDGADLPAGPRIAEAERVDEPRPR